MLTLIFNIILLYLATFKISKYNIIYYDYTVSIIILMSYDS